MESKTLVILAAGMSTRFGSRIKQLEPIGPNGELIIDYSVTDALEAGFDKVVFIIRRDIEQLFKETIGDRISKIVKTEYVFQEKTILPVRQNDFKDRTKPWGTAQALYCCKDVLNGNYGVINADDYYGREAFAALGGFLDSPDAAACSVGFVLKNTLSDHGTVNRGICHIDGKGLLSVVEETRGISRGDNGIITGTRRNAQVTLGENDIVSMSMWGFTPEFSDRLSRRLEEFIAPLKGDDLTAEMTIADAVDMEIKQTGFTVRNISTDSKWFGITYEEDVMRVRSEIAKIR